MHFRDIFPACMYKIYIVMDIKFIARQYTQYRHDKGSNSCEGVILHLKMTDQWLQ